MLTRGLILALALLQPVWHALWVPSPGVAPWLPTLLFALPILPATLLAIVNHRTAGFWGGLAALFYFAHGVTEAWANPAAMLPALMQTVLATALVFSASWAGLQARMRRRKG